MADESLPPTPVAKEREHRHPMPLVIKIVEVAISVFIIGLMVDPFNSFFRVYSVRRANLHDVAFVYVAVAGYMLINLIFIIGHFLGERIPKKTSIIFSALGSLLHVIAAGLMIHNWRRMMGSYIDFQNNAMYSSKQYNDMLISGAVFTFVNAAVFALDVFITARYT